MIALSLLQSFSEYLAAFPSGLYTFLAALVGVLGIGWQLREHRKRRYDNRLAEMRREVYLALFECMANAEQCVRRFWSPNVTQDKLEDLIKDLPATSLKVEFVGQLKTVRALLNFQLELFKAYSSLISPRLDVLKLQFAQDRALKTFEESKANTESAQIEISVLKSAAENAMKAKQRKAFEVCGMASMLADGLDALRIELIQAAREDMELERLSDEEYKQISSHILNEQAKGLKANLAEAEGDF